ncbi:uncharacterized protein LOC141821542 [Curcuma longa]|uniref:uncharacterized protein LOC141821542 n=1 Tax=Curcuma longa TaxID=136217 RepID=UPI003D9F73B8
METPGYLGGIGGKLRRKSLRRVATTPYDRPATAARGFRGPALEPEGGRWLAKLVDPASRFIASSASRLFSSLFRKRLTAPMSEEDPGEASQSQAAQEVNEVVSHDLPPKPPENEAGNKNIAANNHEDNVVLEFERLIKEKSFTRAQYEHLMVVLQSRTTDLDTTNTGANGEKIDDVIVPLPATRTDSSSLLEDLVVDDHAVTPVELAKEYMRAKVSNVSSTPLNWQNHHFHENKQVRTDSRYGAKKLNHKTARSLVQFSLPAEIPESSYFTPRPLGRSAMYTMEGSHCAKVDQSLKDGYVGTLSHKASDDEHTEGLVRKRCSSALYSDFRSTCPIRRVRQKLGINSSMRTIHSVFPGNVDPSSSTVKKVVQDDSSVKSTEMENKILHQLDKLLPSPKGKSAKLNDDPVEESPSNWIHTIPKGTINPLSHKQGRFEVLMENGQSTSLGGVKSRNAVDKMNFVVPETAFLHDNNAVDAGITDYIAVSRNQEPTFQIGETKDTGVDDTNLLMDPSSRLNHRDEVKISQHKANPPSPIRTEGSPTVFTSLPVTSLFSSTIDLKPSIDTVANYSKGFTFPSVSATSQQPPTPTLPGPLVEKSTMQKGQSTTTLVTSGSLDASRAQSTTNKDSSHASNLENGTRLSNVTSSIVSSDPAPQISSADLEGKSCNTSTFSLHSANQGTTLKFGSNSSAFVAESPLPSGDSGTVLAVPTVCSSVVSSTAASSQSVFSAKVFSGTRIAQQTSDASESRFQSTFENKPDSDIVLAPPIVFSSNCSNPAAASSLSVSVGGRQSTLAPILPDTNNTKPGVFSTMLTNSTSSNLDDSTKTSPPSDHITSFAGTWSNQVQSGSSHISESLGSHCHSTSGNRANGGSVMPAFGVSTVPSLFFNAAGSQSALPPTTLSGKSNGHSNLGSGSSTVTSTGCDAVRSTQVQSRTPPISNSSRNQFPSFFPSSTLGTNIAASSSSGSLQFWATNTNSSFSTTATATTTTTLLAAASSSLFGSSSQSQTLPAFGGFGSTSLPSTFNAPFVFGSSSNPPSSASSSGHPAVTQMSIEVSPTADVNLSTGSMVQQFGRPGTAFAATGCGASSPFQSGSQQNSSPQPFLPQFQASGSSGFPQGGSFAMGSGGGGGGGGGGGDKSGRRIVKIRRDKRKK